MIFSSLTCTRKPPYNTSRAQAGSSYSYSKGLVDYKPTPEISRNQIVGYKVITIHWFYGELHSPVLVWLILNSRLTPYALTLHDAECSSGNRSAGIWPADSFQAIFRLYQPKNRTLVIILLILARVKLTNGMRGPLYLQGSSFGDPLGLEATTVPTCK